MLCKASELHHLSAAVALCQAGTIPPIVEIQKVTLEGELGVRVSTELTYDGRWGLLGRVGLLISKNPSRDALNSTNLTIIGLKSPLCS